MSIEIAVMAYTIICASLLLASIFMIPARTVGDKKLIKSSSQFITEMERLIIMRQQGVEITEQQAVDALCGKKLSIIADLMAFTAAIEELRGRYDGYEIDDICTMMLPEFTKLCRIFVKRKPLEKTYFIYSLGIIFYGCGGVSRGIEEFLQVSLRTNSIYCRQNALATVYKIGDIALVVRIINILNRTYADYSQRLISDGLVEFNGDERLLANALLDNYTQYNTYMRLAVLNFIRYTQDGHNDLMMDVLCGEDTDTDLRIAAIRYFGKNKDERVRAILEGYLTGKVEEATPECVAVCATSLANYPGGNTFEILKKSLSSSDWFVRLNASVSLEQLGFDYHQMSDILSGNDRYAREIVHYRMQQHRIMQKKEAV